MVVLQYVPADFHRIEMCVIQCSITCVCSLNILPNLAQFNTADPENQRRKCAKRLQILFGPAYTTTTAAQNFN